MLPSLGEIFIDDFDAAFLASASMSSLYKSEMCNFIKKDDFCSCCFCCLYVVAVVAKSLVVCVVGLMLLLLLLRHSQATFAMNL